MRYPKGAMRKETREHILYMKQDKKTDRKDQKQTGEGRRRKKMIENEA